jgi:ATP-dependent protease HslVU (ClpYQ) ATPase subunit
MRNVLVLSFLLLTGCATEHASKLANMNKWQANCTNAATERALYIKNIVILEQQGIGKKEDPIRIQKIAFLNELILESDRLCGPEGYYTQPQHS